MLYNIFYGLKWVFVGHLRAKQQGLYMVYKDTETQRYASLCLRVSAAKML